MSGMQPVFHSRSIQLPVHGPRVPVPLQSAFSRGVAAPPLFALAASAARSHGVLPWASRLTVWTTASLPLQFPGSLALRLVMGGMRPSMQTSRCREACSLLVLGWHIEWSTLPATLPPWE